MTYPTEIPAFQNALGALVAGDLPTIEASESLTEEQAEAATADVASKIDEAKVAGSVVTQCGLVLDAFKDRSAILSANAAAVQAGAAHLVLRNKWLGREDEADATRDAARDRLAELEA